MSGIDDQELLAKALGQPELIVCNLSSIPQPQNVNNLSTVQQPQKLNNMGIVHLGRCKGVSLKHTLNCHLAEFTKIAEAPSHSKIYHMSIPEVNLFEIWLLLIRDPVDCVLLWWRFNHKDNLNYRQDYPSVAVRSFGNTRIFEWCPTLDDFIRKGSAQTKRCPMQNFSTDGISSTELLLFPWFVTHEIQF